MNKIGGFFSLIFCSFLFSNCASILSESSYPLTVTTDPVGAQVTIKDKNGQVMYMDASPATLVLDASDGFFKKAKYTITVSQDGYASKTVPINFKVDGWYWGNLLLCGVVGMLIVDPATGAMYKLEQEYVNIRLKETGTASTTPQLNVIELQNIPEGWSDKLVQINP